MNNPLISIVIPIYNSENQLEQCIDSLLNQTYQNLEIILVDDGSKDSSWDKWERYAQKDSRIKAVHKENGGVSSARNLGIQYATGEYLGFLDSDDYVSPDLYADLVDILNSNPGLDGIRYQFRNVYGSELRESSSSKNLGAIPLDSKLKAMQLILVDKEFPSVAIFLFKRQKIRHTFNEDVKTAEDYLFMMHYIMHAEKVFITNKVYYYYVYNQNSITRASITPERALSYLKSQLFVCRVADKYISKYSLSELHNAQIEDITSVISNNVNSLFPDITYSQYKKYIEDARSLRDFRYFNRSRIYDSVLNPSLLFYLSKKMSKTGKKILKGIINR